MTLNFINVLESLNPLQCKAGGGTPLYLMMQKRQETKLESKQPLLFYSVAQSHTYNLQACTWNPWEYPHPDCYKCTAKTDH